jgi:hypothetical protein
MYTPLDNPYNLVQLDALTLIQNKDDTNTMRATVNRFVSHVSDLDQHGRPTKASGEYVQGFQTVMNKHLYSITDPFDGSEGHVAAFGPEQELTVFVEGSHWVFYHDDREVLAYFL